MFSTLFVVSLVMNLLHHGCLFFFNVQFSRYVDSLITVDGDNEIRTRDPLLARQVLSQLSYTPINLASTYSPIPSPV